MSDIAAHLGKKNEAIERLMVENTRLRSQLKSAVDLAMMALQSNRYQNDPDYRDAVDGVLGITRPSGSDAPGEADAG